MDVKVAILIDGSFFLKRLKFYKRHYFPSKPRLTPEQLVRVLHLVIRKHLTDPKSKCPHITQHLYRVFFYDAPPLTIKAHYPLPQANGQHCRFVDFSKQDDTLEREAKMARTKGIDFLLDPLRNHIDPALHEHIDGLVSYDLVSIIKDVLGCEPDKIPDWWRTPQRAAS